MMKKLYTFLIALFFIGGAMGQGCLPDGISFETQAQIDSFQINYPGCTEIEGEVSIHGDITNLEGLNVLSSIGGSLTCGGDGFYGNAPCPYLTSLDGLSNLVSIGGDLRIWQCHSLKNLHGLENLTSIGGGLSIGVTGLLEAGNDSLLSLAGIENIDPETISWLSIAKNPQLTTCDIYSICSYIIDYGGSVDVAFNAVGCNSQEEIEEACIVSIDDLNLLKDLSIYPNPTNSSLTIELPTQPTKNTTLTISNTNGQQLITQAITYPQTEIDISSLPAGIYIVKVWNDKDVMVRKVIKQ